MDKLLTAFFTNSNLHIWQTFNALFIIRSMIKYINETGASEFQLLQHFEAIPNPEAIEKQSSESTSDAVAVQLEQNHTTPTTVVVDGSKFETFIDAIVNLIVVIPVKYASLFSTITQILLKYIFVNIAENLLIIFIWRQSIQ